MHSINKYIKLVRDSASSRTSTHSGNENLAIKKDEDGYPIVSKPQTWEKTSTLPSPMYSTWIWAESECIPGGMVGMVGIW